MDGFSFSELILIVIVAIIAGRQLHYVGVRKPTFVLRVEQAIGLSISSCAVLTATPSLRVSRYATRLVHTTMGMALFARHTNSSHFAPIVAVQAGALLKMPV